MARLPVPALRSTLDRYLRSLEPFLLEDETRGGERFVDAMNKRIAWAREFEEGIGRVCQNRLIGSINPTLGWVVQLTLYQR